MRFISINLILVLLFCSCTSEKSLREKYFSPPFTYEIVFSDKDADFEGELSFDGKEMTFLPRSPEGYRITISENGCEVEYEGLVFSENILPSSRFLPLYEMLKDVEEYKIFTDPLIIKKDDIKIIFKDT
ncbi:MAG: hypothetical protein J6Q67_01895, partial [Clostridia bacterium]|nr:hypothetical protein [Clostridia bacterium]